MAKERAHKLLPKPRTYAAILYLRRIGHVVTRRGEEGHELDGFAVTTRQLLRFARKAGWAGGR